MYEAKRAQGRARTRFPKTLHANSCSQLCVSLLIKGRDTRLLQVSQPPTSDLTNLPRPANSAWWKPPSIQTTPRTLESFGINKMPRDPKRGPGKESDWMNRTDAYFFTNSGTSESPVNAVRLLVFGLEDAGRVLRRLENLESRILRTCRNPCKRKH